MDLLPFHRVDRAGFGYNAASWVSAAHDFRVQKLTPEEQQAVLNRLPPRNCCGDWEPMFM